jgi:hypothetical protein
MKTLVVYLSQTGNTRKVAESIYAALEGEKVLLPLEDIRALQDYDLIFFGFPIHAFAPAEAARVFLGTHAVGRRLALFITHAVPEDYPELDQWLRRCRKAAEGAEIVDQFHCQGELAEGIRIWLLQSKDSRLRRFGERGAASKGQPDASRLQRAGAFARDLQARVAAELK